MAAKLGMAGQREVLDKGHWVLSSILPRLLTQPPSQEKSKAKLQMWRSSPDRLGNLPSDAQQSNMQNDDLNLAFEPKKKKKSKALSFS